MLLRSTLQEPISRGQGHLSGPALVDHARARRREVVVGGLLGVSGAAVLAQLPLFGPHARHHRQGPARQVGEYRRLRARLDERGGVSYGS